MNLKAPVQDAKLYPSMRYYLLGQSTQVSLCERRTCMFNPSQALEQLVLRRPAFTHFGCSGSVGCWLLVNSLLPICDGSLNARAAETMPKPCFSNTAPHQAQTDMTSVSHGQIAATELDVHSHIRGDTVSGAGDSGGAVFDAGTGKVRQSYLIAAFLALLPQPWLPAYGTSVLPPPPIEP